MSGVREQLVVTSNVVQLQPCSLYAHSHPLVEAHHVAPLSWWLAANLPVATPMRALCPNCHYSTHVAIDGILRKLDVSLLPLRCIALAQQAFVIAKQYGLTPAPTL